MRHENFKRSWDDVSHSNAAAFSQNFVNFINDLDAQKPEECK